MKDNKIVIVDGFKLTHGMNVSCRIEGGIKTIYGKISISEGGDPYICQDKYNGEYTPERLGYRYSWNINAGLDSSEIENFKILKDQFKPVVVDDITFYHGEIISCEMDGDFITGRISLDGDEGGIPYICQDKYRGSIAKNKLGYKHSWSIQKGIASNDVKNLIFLDNEFTFSKEDKVFQSVIIDDITFNHNTVISCTIEDTPIIGRVSLDGADAPYICQSHKHGWNADDKLGYEHSWSIAAGFIATNVADIKIDGVFISDKDKISKTIDNSWYADVKVGDTLMCSGIPGKSIIGYESHSKTGGVGWKSNGVFTVKSIKKLSTADGGTYIFFNEADEGIYHTSISPYGVFIYNEPSEDRVCAQDTVDKIKEVLNKVSLPLTPEEAYELLIPQTKYKPRLKTFDPIIELGF